MLKKDPSKYFCSYSIISLCVLFLPLVIFFTSVDAVFVFLAN